MIDRYVDIEVNIDIDIEILHVCAINQCDVFFR